MAKLVTIKAAKKAKPVSRKAKREANPTIEEITLGMTLGQAMDLLFKGATKKDFDLSQQITDAFYDAVTKVNEVNPILTSHAAMAALTLAANMFVANAA